MFVTVPDPVTLINKATGKPMRKSEESSAPDTPWSMHRWLISWILPDPAMGKGYKVRRACRKIDDAFADTRPGDVVEVDDDHCDMVVKVIDSPEGGGNNIVLMQFSDFEEAWKKADEKDPRLTDPA